MPPIRRLCYTSKHKTSTHYILAAAVCKTGVRGHKTVRDWCTVVVKKSLSEQVYETLRREILDQTIGFGEKLINRDLQERFGVSSTPVRDAINRLHLDGLVVDISNGGSRVIDFDYQVALEINEIVAVLNMDAIELSAQKAEPDEVVEKLQACIKRQIEHIDSSRYFEYDEAFHQVFFDYSYNQRFQNLYTQHNALWELLIRFYYKDKESTRGKAIERHEQIVAAYKNGNIQQARHFMEKHFIDAVRPFAKLLNHKMQKMEQPDETSTG